MYSIKLIYAIIAALILGCASLQAQALKYNVTVLGIDPQTDPWATGINNFGEIVGWFYSDYHQTQSAFLYSNGTVTDLSTMIGGTNNAANDINDKGQIVGWFSSPSESLNAFLFSLDEGTKYIGQGALSKAYAVNNAGQAVGSTWTSSNTLGAAIFLPNGTIILLNLFGSCSDINDNYGSNGIGQVVGSNMNSGKAFAYSNGVVMSNITFKICPNSDDSIASSINDASDITGFCQREDFGFVYDSLYQETSYLEQSNEPYRINNSGWVIGGRYGSYSEPFLYINGVTHDLMDLIPMDSGISILDPADINDQGQIAANSNLGPLLLTPIEPVY